jgi:DNA (cytosine-5)-methyltransferase 1
MISVGGLFSGYGGIELGLEQTKGFKTLWHCEIEPYPSAILHERFPGVPNLGDITKVKWNEQEHKVDIICGGFPCQDISQAGKRKGIIKGETRSGLWGEFHRAIRILRPRYVLIENVSAITNLGLDIVLADLAQERYDAEWLDLRASDFGAPHRRERIFIVGYISNTDDSRYIHSDVSHTLRKGFHGQQQPFRSEKTHSFKSEHGGWETECGLDRVVNGLTRGLDSYIWRERIKALGNGVVPQVARWVGERILEREKRLSDDLFTGRGMRKF